MSGLAVVLQRETLVRRGPDAHNDSPVLRRSNMFWLVAAAVIVVLFALAWWTSGRAKPMGKRRTPGAIDTEQEAMAQMQQHRMGPTLGGNGLGSN